MDNEKIINDLITLKENGISYKSISDAVNIPYSTFYYYLRVNKIPYNARKRIGEYIYTEYKELFKNE